VGAREILATRRSDKVVGRYFMPANITSARHSDPARLRFVVECRQRTRQQALVDSDAGQEKVRSLRSTYGSTGRASRQGRLGRAWNACRLWGGPASRSSPLSLGRDADRRTVVCQGCDSMPQPARYRRTPTPQDRQFGRCFCFAARRGRNASTPAAPSLEIKHVSALPLKCQDSLTKPN
jgi:hypothetical protein